MDEQYKNLVMIHAFDDSDGDTWHIYKIYVYINRFGSSGMGDIAPLFLPKKQKGPHETYGGNPGYQIYKVRERN